MAIKGLKKFKEYFSDFKENYVIIGGTACSIILRDADMKPRAMPGTLSLHPITSLPTN